MRRTLLLLAALAVLGVAAGCLDGGESLGEANTSEAGADPNGTEANVTGTDTGPSSANGTEESSAPAEDATPSADEPEPADGPRAYEMGYGGLAGPIERSVEIEGAFGPNETCVPVGCARSTVTGGDPIHHDVRLDPHFPSDVPVRIAGELSYDQETTGDVHPNLRTGEAQLYGARITNTAGPTDVDVRLSSPPDNPVVLEVGGHAPEGPEGTAYRGTLTVSADPDVVPAGVPTGVPVPADAEALELQPEQGERVAFTLWGPSGDVVTAGPVDAGEARIDVANSSAGEYTLQVRAPAEGARVSIVADEAPSGSLDALATVPVVGSSTEALPGRAASGTFEAPAPPVAVGVYERSSQPVMSRTGEDPGLEITSSQGTVMDRSAGQAATFDTPLWIGGGFEDRYVTAPGVEGLVAGSYDFEVTDHRDVGASFGGFALVWEGAVADAS